MNKETLQKLQGKRLRECLDRCGLSQKSFCDKVHYDTSSLNQILSTKVNRGIPDYLLTEWSEILGVDAGYFIAKEGIETYDDYKGIVNAKEDWKEQLQFLKYANIKIINMNIVDNKVYSYQIFDKDSKKSMDISKNEMEKIKEKVSDYIKYLMQTAMKEGDALD